MRSMEGNRRNLRKRKRGLDLSTFDRTTFPLMLAAVFNPRNPDSQSTLKRFLRAHLALLAEPDPELLVPPGLLALIPFLLRSRCPSVAVLGAEVIGAVALCSIEANALMASDEWVVRGLVSALGDRNQRVVAAACDAVLDLASSPVGRDRLRDSLAVEKLLSLFCKVATFFLSSTSFQSVERGRRRSDDSKSGIQEDNFPRMLLDAVAILINTSSEDFLERIPENLVKVFLPLLKTLWSKIRDLTVPPNCKMEQCFSQSSKCDLAALIFRLSMSQTPSVTWKPYEVRMSMFGSTESDFENFVSNHWEHSPLLFRGALKSSENNNTIFTSLVSSFTSRTTETILNSILQHLVSCHPIASDELDIFSFLNEVHGVLGSPIIYGQDIRVVKTLKLTSDSMQGDMNEEVHFFKCKMGSEFIDTDNVQKCKEAFDDGYTVALRGMEFRLDKVAEIADGLAVLFGQPSVGANIYLTPPGSQGLAPHYDDHCVFVWQLFGQKQWRISPHPATLLPRLYEPRHVLPGLEGDICGGVEYALEEGDVLYVPRGWVHEARTSVDNSESQDEASCGFSLHLTLGIEVELPFEWEGFVHVALHCWNEKQKQDSCLSIDYKKRKQRFMFVNLLHVAIRLTADSNPIFRKACMIAAHPLSSDTLAFNQKATFSHIIETIDATSSFAEAFKCVEAVFKKRNDDSLQWMRWLHHLPQGVDESEIIDFNNLLGSFEELVALYRNHIEEAMIEFSQVKTKFCQYVVFEDACECFNLMLKKYRKTRKQYMKGMLSLHST